MPNPSYGTPEPSKPPGPGGIQDERTAPSWGTPGDAPANLPAYGTPRVPQPSPQPPIRRPRPKFTLGEDNENWQVPLSIGLGVFVVALIGLGIQQAVRDPGRDNPVCRMLPSGDLNHVLDGDVDHRDDGIDDDSCAWTVGDTVVSLSSGSLRSPSGDRPAPPVEYEKERIEAGAAESVYGLGEFASWTPVRNSLYWYTEDRTYHLVLDGDGASLESATALAERILATTDEALGRQ